MCLLQLNQFNSYLKWRNNTPAPLINTQNKRRRRKMVTPSKPAMKGKEPQTESVIKYIVANKMYMVQEFLLSHLHYKQHKN